MGKLKSFFKKVGSTVKSGAKIVGTNIKNSVSKDSISAFVKGFAAGGLPGAIANAAITTTTKSMVELDRSGNFNEAYAYKLGGFANNEDYQLALENGFENASDFLASLKNYGFDSIEKYRNALTSGSIGEVAETVGDVLNTVQEVVVKPQNEGGASSVENVGGAVVVTPPATPQVVPKTSSLGSIGSKYDGDTALLRSSL